MNLSVVIPSYRGRRLLPGCLSKLMEHAPHTDVVVVDDGSDDGSVDTVRSDFPGVKVVARRTNGGFSAAVNDGIRAAQAELIALINNDVEITGSFLELAREFSAQEATFAVSPRIVVPRLDNTDEGAKTGFWHHGLFFTGQRQGPSELSPILYATGCAAIYRRSMLEALGGFDEAYSPFYWEDVDLGYRAWKRGWQTVYDPSGLVYHQHSASISQWPRRHTETIKARNSLLFIWRNIEDNSLLREHRRWLAPVLARRTLTGDISFLLGWQQAYRRRREAVAARTADSVRRVLSDRTIFETTGVECGRY